jgi:hypothetical protein
LEDITLSSGQRTRVIGSNGLKGKMRKTRVYCFELLVKRYKSAKIVKNWSLRLKNS